MSSPFGRLSRLSVRARLGLLAGAAVVGYTAAGLQQLSTLDRYRIGGEVHARLAAQEESIESLNTLLGEVYRLNSTVRSLSDEPSADEIRQTRDRLEEIVEGVDARFERVHGLQAATGMSDPSLDAADTWSSIPPPLLAQLTPGAPFDPKAFHAFLDGAHRRKLARMAGELEDSLNSFRLKTAALEQEAEAGVQRAKVTLLLTEGLLGAGLLGLFLLIGTSIVRRLSSLVQLSERVGAGDLTVELPAASGDELGRVAEGLGQMVGRLRGMVGTLAASAVEVGDAAARMRSVASEQLDATERQAAAVQETQVTADEIQQASRLTSARAEQLRQASEAGLEVGRLGTAALEASRSGIEAIRTGIEEIGRRIGALGARAQTLSRATRTLDDLTDQTNMLALNAAMEAMRAGPRGRMFSVVAREMRGLTDRAAESTGEIGRELAATEEALRHAVVAAESGRDGINVGLGEIEIGARSLQDVAEVLTRSLGGVSEIATAVGQQDLGIRQIYGALSDLGATLSQSKDAVERIHDAVGLLERAAAKVRDSSATFRV